MRYTIFIISLLTLIGCSDLDNYDAPNSSIQGAIYDLSTNDSIPGQAPDGARIKLFEGNNLQSRNFWVKTDGSFYNGKVFSGTYKVLPEGPFITLTTDTVVVTLPTSNDISFNVEPFLRINVANAKLNGTTATVNFTISKSSQWNESLIRYMVLYSTTDALSASSYAGPSQSFDVSSEESVLGIEQEVKLEGIDITKPVFVRVAAITSGTNYYNYSKIVRL